MAANPSLIVSEDRRRLQKPDGTPFFYLADTAWEIAHRLTREEVQHYLDVRAEQEFSVIQIMGLCEYDGFGPNRYGDRPLHDMDPTRPNEAYFEHMDFIVREANARGIFVALLPTWGDKVYKAWGAGPELFNPSNARAWGRWMGSRYRDADIIWVIGGDRSIENESHLATWREMAAGVTEGDGGRHLKTFHPAGSRSSSQCFHNDPWLDFNMIQSGHTYRELMNWDYIRRDLDCYPPKPTLDAEPAYEDHPLRANYLLNGTWGYFNELDVRKAMYNSLLAGACGHTYGCHAIWQFYNPSLRPGVNRVRTPWQAALHLQGANQLRHARRLMLSRSWPTLTGDQALLYEFWGWGPQHRQAARTKDRRHALVYLSDPRPLRIVGKHLVGDTFRVHWFDPSSGTARYAGDHPREDILTFTPPIDGDGPDWVLCLDDISVHMNIPGAIE